MPSTIMISVAMQNTQSDVTESLNDVINSQYGRNSTLAVGTANAYWTFPWPTTGETVVYLKFPQQSTSYTVKIIHDVNSPIPVVFTVPGGAGFTPFMFPQPPAASDGQTYIGIESSVILPSVPAFYF